MFGDDIKMLLFQRWLDLLKSKVHGYSTLAPDIDSTMNQRSNVSWLFSKG